VTEVAGNGNQGAGNVDALDPQKLAQFWALALNYVLEPPPPGFDSWDQYARQNQIPPEQWRAAAVDPDGLRPRLYFQPVPDGKTAKNRVHLDVQAGTGAGDPANRRQVVAEHVARLADAGATRRGLDHAHITSGEPHPRSRGLACPDSRQCNLFPRQGTYPGLGIHPPGTHPP